MKFLSCPHRPLIVLIQIAGFLFALSAFASNPGETPERVRIMEAYPEDVQQQLETRGSALRNALRTASALGEQVTVQYVLDMKCRWKPGTTLTVAFSGGTPELREKIEAAATEWSKYCNIKFDFRAKGKFREWSSSDKAYHAKIRIAFMTGQDGGYWSALGNDSVNPKYYRPNRASMNFEGFPNQLPGDYAATVQHEFGHALSFWHEHQHPKERCDEQLRWDDETGYVPTRNQYGEFIPDSQNRHPGVYTVFGGPPNNWSKEKIDFAMKHIDDVDTHAYKVGPFDKESIMKYYYPASLFIEGNRSPCYHEENSKISTSDRQGAASVYPTTTGAIRRILEEKKRLLDMLLRTKSLSPEFEQEYRPRLDSLTK
jgi:hypothetical protein